ncbi:phosphate:sodium symporter, partial [Formosa algae]
IGGTAFAQESYSFLGGLTIGHYIENEVLIILLISFAFWSSISYIYMAVLKLNIYKLIILIGTFALALAFAGNDLVNFIGVPIAAWQSYQEWSVSGIPADQFNMAILGQAVRTPTLMLFIAGMVMVVTLWFSSKAKAVVKTSIDLASSQNETKERFQPNFLSRGFVRTAVGISDLLRMVVPDKTQEKIDRRFEKPTIALERDKKYELPAFDMVRAAVNLMVASVLISIATSMKLPLSTTYVTFMVAMGTSLADKAWGAESAVYRVAGVLNVIGGWFFTALIAFVSAAIIAYLINLHVPSMVGILLLIAFLLLSRNYLMHNKRQKELKAEGQLIRAESSSIQGVVHESAHNIANAIKRVNKIYTGAINGLSKQDLIALKQNKKQVEKLANEIDELRDNIFYFIKNLDESSVAASNFYINILGYLQDMSQSLEYISKVSYKHVNNNHKKLKFNQIKELKQIDTILEKLFSNTQKTFENRSFEDIGDILKNKKVIFTEITDKIQKQVERTRTEEVSPKNTTLYFSLLLETKDLLTATMNLLEEFYHANDGTTQIHKIIKDEELEE